MNRPIDTYQPPYLPSSFSSADLAASLTDETGTNLAVFSDGPVLDGNVHIDDESTGVLANLKVLRNANYAAGWTTPVYVYNVFDANNGAANLIHAKGGSIDYFKVTQTKANNSISGAYGVNFGASYSSNGGAMTSHTFKGYSQAHTSGTSIGFKLSQSTGAGLGGTARLDLLQINLEANNTGGSGGQYLIAAQLVGSDKFTVTKDGVGAFAGDVTVADEAYGAGWNGSAEVPTKNAVYDKIETIGGGGGAFSADGDTLITPTTPIVLDHATNSEVALTLSYTTNKAAGNDSGLLISMTDTASPGTSLPLDVQVGGTSKASISNAGTITSSVATATANAAIFKSTDDSATNPLIECQDSAGTAVVHITAAGSVLASEFTNPTGSTLGEVFGAGASTDDPDSVVIGQGSVIDSSTASGTTGGNIVIGQHTDITASGTVTNFDDNILIGRDSSLAGSSSQVRQNIFLGGAINLSGGNFIGSVAIGHGVVPVSGSVVIGASATVANFGTAVGFSADSGNSGTSLGYNVNATTSSVAVGANANASGNPSVAIGKTAAAGPSSTAVGETATASNTACVALGRGATSTGNNQLVIGSSSYPTDNWHGGKGVADATPTVFTINGTGGSGTDIAGAVLQIAGGKGTGTGVGGSVKIITAPGDAGTGATLNDLSATVMEAGANATVGLLGFFGATAVIKQAGTGEATGFTAGAGTGVNDDSTFTGNVGATAYRISDIVKALKNYGLLTS